MPAAIFPRTREPPPRSPGRSLGGLRLYSYGWTFGDGATSSGSPTPSHVYANPGTYTATLTAQDNLGDVGTSSVLVTVNDVAPSVTLTAPTSGEAGVSESFSASATDISPADQAAGFTYSWVFGDGGTATGANPSHTFAAAGTYTVTATATDEYGTMGTASGTVVVVGPPTVNAGSAFTVNAGTSTTFSQATESGGTAPFTYSWTFGDGSTASGSLNPSHTYANPGSDTATVTVTDADNVTSSSSVVVTVNDVAPSVTLTAPTSGEAGVSESFSASATDISPAVQAAGFTYSWMFGDGGTATGASPSHTFAAAGTYTVTVTATDEYGKTGTASGTIVIASGDDAVRRNPMASSGDCPGRELRQRRRGRRLLYAPPRRRRRSLPAHPYRYPADHRHGWRLQRRLDLCL